MDGSDYWNLIWDLHEIQSKIYRKTHDVNYFLFSKQGSTNEHVQKRDQVKTAQVFPNFEYITLKL